MGQIKLDIALGRLIKEEKLPTVRQLAKQLAINPNTIAKAYRLKNTDYFLEFQRCVCYKVNWKITCWVRCPVLSKYP